MSSSPEPLSVALTTPVLRRGELLVSKQRVPLREPLGPALEALAHRQGEATTAAEARWLLQARNPGVVAVRRVEPANGLLLTAHAGHASLASADLPPAAVARVLADVAATLADLHRLGLGHGAVTAEHIVLAPYPPGERPRGILCAPRAETGRPDDDLRALHELVVREAGRVDRRGVLWTDAMAALAPLSGDPPPAAAARDALETLATNLERRPSPGEGVRAAVGALRRLWASIATSLDEPADPWPNDPWPNDPWPNDR